MPKNKLLPWMYSTAIQIPPAKIIAVMNRKNILSGVPGFICYSLPHKLGTSIHAWKGEPASMLGKGTRTVVKRSWLFRENGPRPLVCGLIEKN
jgi:hypothetical protein